LSQILETIQEKPLKEKLHLMAETIRNHQGIEQCKYDLWKGENKFCVMGLLGFRAGIPKEELPYDAHPLIYDRIFEKYGIPTKKADEIYIKNPMEWTDHHSNLRHIFMLNDIGYSFDEIADWIDETAESLK